MLARAWLPCVGLWSITLFASPGAAQPAGEAKPDLRLDARLAAPITMNIPQPTAEEIVEEIKRATGVSLSINRANVETREPAFFGFRQYRMPGWIVMQQLTTSKMVKGQWVKEGDGCQLVGTVQPRPPEAAASPPSHALRYWRERVWQIFRERLR